jgi:hypothetical protein
MTIITNRKLSPWGRLILEKVINLQALQKVPRFWDTKVYYHVDKCPQLAPFLCRIISVYLLPKDFLKICFNNILPSKLKSSEWSVPFVCSYQNLLCVFLFSRTCHRTRNSHCPWFDIPNGMWWGVKIMKLGTVKFQPVPCYLVLLRPKYLPQHSTLNNV